MEYQKVCKFCRKPFVANRKDQVFHNNACKVKYWKLLRGFTLLKELVPEKEVKEKYYIPQDSACTIFIQWFKHNGERFADIYISKTISENETINRYKNQLEIRYAD